MVARLARILRRLLDIASDLDSAEGIPKRVKRIVVWTKRIVSAALAIVWAIWLSLPWELRIPVAVLMFVVLLALVDLALGIVVRIRRHLAALRSPLNESGSPMAQPPAPPSEVVPPVPVPHFDRDFERRMWEGEMAIERSRAASGRMATRDREQPGPANQRAQDELREIEFAYAQKGAQDLHFVVKNKMPVPITVGVTVTDMLWFNPQVNEYVTTADFHLPPRHEFQPVSLRAHPSSVIYSGDRATFALLGRQTNRFTIRIPSQGAEKQIPKLGKWKVLATVTWNGKSHGKPFYFTLTDRAVKLGDA